MNNSKTAYQTTNLTGLLLDWATLDAGAGGLAVQYTPDQANRINGLTPTVRVWEPTVDRAQAMLLLEDARLSMVQSDNGIAMVTRGEVSATADDLPTAICRAYVLLRRGPTVEIPEDVIRFADHCDGLRNEI